MSFLLLAVYGLLMLALSVYTAHAFLMVYLYRRRHTAGASACRAWNEWPRVTVQLPIYNERYVVARLLAAVAALDYPRDCLEIQVLDDSTDDTRTLAGELVAQYRARGLDMRHYHRADRAGFKAGALRAGLAQAAGEFIAIFDADFVPPRDFLKKLLPHFHAAHIGMVQARWGHLNRLSSLLTRGQAIGLDAHFVLEHGARNAAGLFINFNGTAGIWRKAAILDAGNWQDDTLTEDLDLSYRAQLAGWQFVYVNDVVCPAEVPAEVYGLKSQQYRWAKGAIQTAKKLLPGIWHNPALSPLAKFEATIHLTNHLVFPVLLLTALLSLPLLVIRLRHPETGWVFILFSAGIINLLGYPLFYIYAQREIHDDWRRRVLFLPVLLAGAIGLSVINTRAVCSALCGRRSAFIRTPKFGLGLDGAAAGKTLRYRQRFNSTVVAEILLAVYLSLTLVFAIDRLPLANLPLVLIYWLGFLFIGTLSLAHAVRR